MNLRRLVTPRSLVDIQVEMFLSMYVQARVLVFIKHNVILMMPLLEEKTNVKNEKLQVPVSLWMVVRF